MPPKSERGLWNAANLLQREGGQVLRCSSLLEGRQINLEEISFESLQKSTVSHLSDIFKSCFNTELLCCYCLFCLAGSHCFFTRHSGKFYLPGLSGFLCCGRSWFCLHWHSHFSITDVEICLFFETSYNWLLHLAVSSLVK